MSDDKLVIYHNPQCSKSRETLQILEQNQCSAEVIEYLREPPTVEELTRIIQLLGISARDLVRTTEVAYQEAGLDDDSLEENQIVEAICKFPSLMQRPVVVRGNKAVIGRPPSKVIEIIA